MIERKKELAELDGLLQRHRVVGMIGARQVGKSTLVEEYLKTVSVPSYTFDLENPADAARLATRALLAEPPWPLERIDLAAP